MLEAMRHLWSNTPDQSSAGNVIVAENFAPTAFRADLVRELSTDHQAINELFVAAIAHFAHGDLQTCGARLHEIHLALRDHRHKETAELMAYIEDACRHDSVRLVKVREWRVELERMYLAQAAMTTVFLGLRWDDTTHKRMREELPKLAQSFRERFQREESQLFPQYRWHPVAES